MRYEVETDLYDGPLWLLVELTRLNLIDIFLVQLAKLTGSYLQDLKRLDVGLNELSEPLPLLGNLLALKARGLLPQPETPLEDEEVPVSLEELERRLKEYEQFKTVAQLLAELHALQHEHFSRKPSGAPLEEPSEKEAAEAEKWGVSVTDLMGAFTRVLRKTTAPLYNVKAEPWTVEMKVEELRVALMVKRQLRFLDIFTAEKSRLELVVTFLALLELIRQRAIRAVQERLFGDISVVWLNPKNVTEPSEK